MCCILPVLHVLHILPVLQVLHIPMFSCAASCLCYMCCILPVFASAPFFACVTCTAYYVCVPCAASCLCYMCCILSVFASAPFFACVTCTASSCVPCAASYLCYMCCILCLPVPQVWHTFPNFSVRNGTLKCLAHSNFYPLFHTRLAAMGGGAAEDYDGYMSVKIRGSSSAVQVGIALATR
jgi:hypothetical protein